MSKTVSVLGNFRVAGAIILDKDYADFPSDAKLGTLAIKDTGLYAYLAFSGIETWYPLIKGSNATYVHTQAIPALEWTVNHALNTNLYWYEVQDTNGNVISEASRITVDSNTFKLEFTEAVAGNVVVVSTSALNVDAIKASLINIGPDVTIDTAGMVIGGKRVLVEGDAAAGGVDLTTINSLISTAIGNEAAARTSAYTVAISSAVSAEATARDTAISEAVAVGTTVTADAITAAVGAEATARIAGDTNETTARTTAINVAITNLVDNAPTEGDTLNKLYTLIGGLQALMQSNDVNLNTIQEFVTRIKSDEGIITSLTTGKVNVSDIVNVLTSTSTATPLSAAQGKALYDALQEEIVNRGNAITGLQATSEKDASGGYVGKTLNAINVYSADGSIKSGMTTLATAVRAYAFPDKNGTIAMLSDITGIATKLGTARNIALTGDVTGTVSFDGSADVSITATLKGDVVQNLGNMTGAISVNYANGNYAYGTVTAANTISLSGVPNDGRAYGLTLELNNAGAFTTTISGSIIWLSGSAPTYKVSGKNIVTLITRDGGSTWLGSST